MLSLEDQLSSKLFQKYNHFLSKTDCIDLAEDICGLAGSDIGEKYITPLKEWLNGKRVYTDVEYNRFSLVEIATGLDTVFPNIPVAALLLMLEEKEADVYRAIPAVAGELCLADPRIITGEQCKFAIKSDGMWSFVLEDTSPDTLEEKQLWQILLLNPILTFQVAYEHPDGTSLVLHEDGYYLIVPPDESGV